MQDEPRVPLQTTVPRSFGEAAQEAARKANVTLPTWLRQLVHEKLNQLGYALAFPTRKLRAKSDTGAMTYDPQILPRVAPQLVPAPGKCKFCDANTWNKLFCNQCLAEGFTKKRPAGARAKSAHLWIELCCNGKASKTVCYLQRRKSAAQCDCCATKRPVPFALRCPKCRSQPVDTGEAAVHGCTHRICDCGHEFRPTVYPVIAIASV